MKIHIVMDSCRQIQGCALDVVESALIQIVNVMLDIVDNGVNVQPVLEFPTLMKMCAGDMERVLHWIHVCVIRCLLESHVM